jgi:hypothetical protein
MRSADDLYSDEFLPELHLTLSRDAMESLEAEPRAYVPGIFRYGPYTIERVGIRLKGSATLETLDNKPAFKVKFNHYVAGQRFFGLEAITLNNLEQDPTMVREYLGYQVFRAAGVPAPRTSYATVKLNDVLLGLYLNIETVDDSFLARNYDDPTGGLYEGDYGDDLHPSHVWRFEHDEGDDLQRTDLLAFTLWIHSPGDEIFYDDRTLLDTEEFLSFAAAEAVVGHWDGYWIAHNYRIYHEPTLDEWTFIPWGIDQVLNKRIEPFNQLSYLNKRCRESARCLPDYVYRTLEVVDLFEDLDLEASYEHIAALIDEPARDDPRKRFSNSQLDNHRDTMLEFIQTRPDEVRARVDCVAGNSEIDADEDGHGSCYADCDDANSAIYPGAAELCDSVDNNCSGNVDDNLECGCPEQMIDGVTFYFCDMSMSWKTARDWCEGLGATLARIDDDAQNDAIWQTAHAARQSTWWIGLSDVEVDEGDFYWVDGSPVEYTNWRDGEPNFEGTEHCGALRQQDAHWADLACGNARPFVCRVAPE